MRTAAALCAAALLCLMPSGAPAAAVEGSWPFYGHDLANSRHAPSGPSAAEVPLMEEEWAFSTDQGDFTGTPIVAEGRVYVGSWLGTVYALDAADGAVVWERNFRTATDRPQIPASLAYADGVVYVPLSITGRPEIVAVNAATGGVLWRTVVDRDDPDNGNRGEGDLYGSPVVWDGKVFTGVSSWNGSGKSTTMHRGSVVALDTISGEIEWKTYMIPPEFNGAAVWSTPAIDTSARQLYVGTGQQYNTCGGACPPREDLNINSIVRIDADTGEITGAYHGSPRDTWNLSQPNTGQDADFGASPQLVEGPNGELWVGGGQKNNHPSAELGLHQQGAPATMFGVARYHMADRRTMEREWVTVVGPGHFLGGVTGSTAYDGERIYGATIWSTEFALKAADGVPAWVTPTGDVPHFSPTAVANGVVWSTDTTGFLNAWDASTGLLLTRRFLGGPTWGGAAITGDWVFAAVGANGNLGRVVAFRSG